MKALMTNDVEATAIPVDRKLDLALVNFIPRAILGLGLLFLGLARFYFDFLQYAKAVGATPYAETLFPASALFSIATAVSLIHIVLAIMILIGLRTKQVLLILAALIVIITAGAGATGLASTVVGVEQGRPDGSGVFGPTGMSITFLKGYTYPLTALVLFLLLMPGGSDAYSFDNLVSRAKSEVSDATARSAAICLARVMVGLVWFIGGINKVFLWGAVGHARNLFVVPYAHTILPTWSLWASGTAIPYLELIFPALVIVGLWTRPSLYVLGGILIMVTFGHLLVTPLYMEGLEPFILARAVLLLLVLMFPKEADGYSIDNLLRRQRSLEIAEKN
jgi:uncharacterized membrane protein YphA (DoxX/SURF4 family)